MFFCKKNLIQDKQRTVLFSLQYPRSKAEKLAYCGCINDALHGVSVEQFCERMKMFGGIKYLDVLRILKDVRYLKTGRVLLK